MVKFTWTLVGAQIPRARLSRSKPPSTSGRLEQLAHHGVLGDPAQGTAEQGEATPHELAGFVEVLFPEPVHVASDADASPRK